MASSDGLMAEAAAGGGVSFSDVKAGMDDRVMGRDGEEE